MLCICSFLLPDWFEHFSFCYIYRPSVSPPKLNTRPNSHVWTPSYADLDKPEEPATNPSDLPVPKRTRLPFSTNPGLRGNNSVHDDTERYDAIE